MAQTGEQYPMALTRKLFFPFSAMHNNFAFVTLLTSDSYLPGALVLSKSLKRTFSKYPLVILVTPETVSVSTIELLNKYFDVILKVSLLRSGQSQELELLGRRELDVTWTKLHCWNLPFDRIVFLDADVLILENIDSLFEYVEDSVFAAAPDVGWPDCFNSGVFVTRPSLELYSQLLDHSRTVASFDGGDQGLLNSFFSSWSGHITPENRNAPKSSRLPFVYNVTPTAFYSYLPAFVHFHPTIMAVHFIGETKPWTWDRFADGGIIPKASVSQQTLDMIRKWWNVFDAFHLYKPLSTVLSNERWTHYKLPIETTRGNFVPNASYFESKTLQNDFERYKVQWNPKEVSVPRSISPDKKKRQPIMDRAKSHTPSTAYKRATPSPQLSMESHASSEFASYKVTWNEQETRPPRERSKSPNKKETVSPYHKFERSISSHSLKVAENPPGDLKDYKISWDEKELNPVLGSNLSSPLSLSPEMKQGQLMSPNYPTSIKEQENRNSPTIQSPVTNKKK